MRAFSVNARGASAQDDATGLELCHFARGEVMAYDLRINLALANTARNDLGVL